MEGIQSWNLLATLPLLVTLLLDFLGLNQIRAKDASLSGAFRIHLACTWVYAVKVRTSMKHLSWGWRNPDLIIGPLDCFTTAVMSRLFPITNKIRKMLQPFMIPFSKSCHWVVNSVVQNCSELGSAEVRGDYSHGVLWDMVKLHGSFDEIMRNWPTCIGQVKPDDC